MASGGSYLGAAGTTLLLGGNQTLTASSVIDADRVLFAATPLAGPTSAALSVQGSYTAHFSTEVNDARESVVFSGIVHGWARNCRWLEPST